MTTLMESKSSWSTASAAGRKWYIIDAKDEALGRLSTRIAMILMGKNKPSYTPSVDGGDFVIALNVDKIRLSGNKQNQKIAFHHTAWPGGARFEPYKTMMVERPERALQLAVKRMLPKNKLASRQILRLKMFRGEQHPHAAQQPAKI